MDENGSIGLDHYFDTIDFVARMANDNNNKNGKKFENEADISFQEDACITECNKEEIKINVWNDDNNDDHDRRKIGSCDKTKKDIQCPYCVSSVEIKSYLKKENTVKK